MAEITRKQWNRYLSRLRNINDKAVESVESYLARKGGFEALGRTDLIDYAYYVANKYGGASSALSAEMYDAIAELSGVAVPSAVPAEITYQDVAKTVNGIIKNTGSNQVLAQGVGRLVKMAGTDTILSNAYRDRPKGKGSKKKHSGAQVAWIPSGDTCPFCLMLASKGWQNQTEWGANNHSEHIHANCDCTYAVRFNNDLNVAGYDPDEYKEMYEDADGQTRDEKLKSMRDKYREENRDKINAQKRAAYALSKEEKNGIIKIGAADLGSGMPVKYDKTASFVVNLPGYSKDVNDGISASARKVAENGSRDNYEYVALIDTSTGTEVDFGTSKDPISVNYHYKFLRDNPNGRFAMVHNHNTESGISLPDVQELSMWRNLDSVTAVTNNGITTSIVSNGVKSDEYLALEFMDVAKGIENTLEREEKQIQAALQKYTKEGTIVHDGRTK